MKKLICTVLLTVALFAGCGGDSGKDMHDNGIIEDGDGIIDENIENNDKTDVGDVAKGAVDGAGDVAKDVVDGAGDVAKDVVDGAGNMARDAADGIGNAVDDIAGNPNKK